jgi:hypothetical protein
MKIASTTFEFQKKQKSSVHGDRKLGTFFLGEERYGVYFSERESEKEKGMVWAVTQQLARGKRTRIWGGAFLCWLCLMLATPKIPHSPKHHLFVDMRNFLGNQTFPPPLYVSVYVLYSYCSSSG